MRAKKAVARSTQNPRATLEAWRAWRASLGDATLGARLFRLHSALERRDYLQLVPLSLEVCRLVLIEPSEATAQLSSACELVAQLVETLRDSTVRASVPARAQLAVVDLINALGSAGAGYPDVAEQIMRSCLTGLTRADFPVLERLRLGFAALALGDVAAVCAILGVSRVEDVMEPEMGEQADLRPALESFVASLQSTGDVNYHHGYWPMSVLSHVLSRPDLFLDVGVLDEPTILWMGRFLYGVVRKAPLGTVARSVHETLLSCIRTVDAIEAERAADAAAPPAFPHHELLANGTYQIEELLQGEGAQQLWQARRLDNGHRALVAFDGKLARQSMDELRAAVSYPIAGGPEVVHVGTVDAPTQNPAFGCNVDSTWLVVEEYPRGEWLPNLLPPIDDGVPAPRMALELGRSAGHLMLQAAEAGHLLLRARPEYMWGVHEGDHWEVTGVSDRADGLFARKYECMVTLPLFDRFYWAPEHYKHPTERSVAYTLAVMIAEWAMGRYPFPTLFHGRGLSEADHVPIEAPAPLKALLERTIRIDPAERPSLAEFVAELDRLEL